MEFDFQPILDAMIFSLIGIVIFLMAFFIMDKLTPVKLKHEIVHNKNTALGIVVGAVMIGLAIIIGMAHG